MNWSEANEGSCSIPTRVCNSPACAIEQFVALNLCVFLLPLFDSEHFSLGLAISGAQFARVYVYDASRPQTEGLRAPFKPGVSLARRATFSEAFWSRSRSAPQLPHILLIAVPPPALGGDGPCTSRHRGRWPSLECTANIRPVAMRCRAWRLNPGSGIDEVWTKCRRMRGSSGGNGRFASACCCRLRGYGIAALHRRTAF